MNFFGDALNFSQKCADSIAVSSVGLKKLPLRDKKDLVKKLYLFDQVFCVPAMYGKN